MLGDVSMSTDGREEKDAVLHDGSLSEEDGATKGQTDTGESPKQKPRNRLHDGQIVEGKREKKTVQRLDIQVCKPKERLKIENGNGDKLGSIARANHYIGRMKVPELKPLHMILFDRPGAVSSMKKHLRLFNGFSFEVDSEPYLKKKEKMTRYTNVKLRTICKVLDLEKGGNQSALIDRIMVCLMHPKISGKPVLIKKKRSKRKKTATKESKRQAGAKSASGSKRKPKVESKSKAIVTDSSSDDEGEEEEEDKRKEAEDESKLALKAKSVKDEQKAASEDEDDCDGDEDEKSKTSSKGKTSAKKVPPAKKSGRAVKRSAPAKRKAKELSDLSESDKEDDDDEEKDHDSDGKMEKKAKTASKGKTSGKKSGRAVKRSAPAKRKAKELSDLSESESNKEDDKEKEDQNSDSDIDKPRSKGAVRRNAPAKPAPKTKKADSSSNRLKEAVDKDASGSSDDDEPLIRMIKKPPTDGQLKDTVKELLKEANLEETTMKQICRKVYDTYPNFDLTSRKDYIKQTVKALIS